jgi:hypothetical protein
MIGHGGPVSAEPRASRRSLILTTELEGAGGGLAVAAAIGVALAQEGPGVLLTELGAERRRPPTVLASRAARELEDRLRDRGFDRAAARGRLCWLALPAADDVLDRLAVGLDTAGGVVAVAYLPASLWLIALGHPALRPSGGLIRAELPRDRAAAALAAIELRERGLAARVVSRPLGRVASRRALAGLEAGGAAGRRVARLARGLRGAASAMAPEPGQSLPMVVGAVFAILFVTAILAALGGALTATARAQRAVDLVALSGARSLRDDFPRLFAPARLPSGAPNPAHLDKREYLTRAADAAHEAAVRNGVEPGTLRLSFPDADSFAPLRVRARIMATVEAPAGPRRGRPARDGEVTVEEHAVAEASPPMSIGAQASGQPPVASGGGYSGPLAYRQGKGMRPDVAAAFDRLAAAAQRAGISLVINSAYRSDAEQARLYAANPDPRWVAPPGQSLHRCATELDLGPPSAYGWLAANARRFGFVKRYSWVFANCGEGVWKLRSGGRSSSCDSTKVP